ncbi:hypothetical protein C1A40_15985 [Tamlana carrageenivorans]|uniref:Uncharacterized protein n=1 Tax=Pseudotamlana carrageenivorans TaxID=2069432 RepID=A0A2I7SLQ5_9FLAO|nr:hypothetical protein C1A40_15985 [Tamlana carrageenivorans]
MRGLELNFASTHQTENPLGFSEVSENKQLLIAIVVHSAFYSGFIFTIFPSCIITSSLFFSFLNSINLS